MRRSAESVHLFPFDQTVGLIVEDERDERDTDAHGCLQFLRVHQETTIAADCQAVAFGIDKFRDESPRYRDAHGSEAVGNDARIRLIARIHPGYPHFVRTDIGDEDVVLGEDRTDVTQNLLRFHRKRFVVTVFCHPRENNLAQRVGGIGQVLRLNSLRQQTREAVLNIAHHFDIGDIGRIAFAGLRVNMDNLLIVSKIPETRMVFHNVVSDGNNQVCPVEPTGDKIARLQPDGKKGQRMRPGDAALAHERVRDRNVSRFCELSQDLGGTLSDDTVSCEDNRLPCFPN